MDWVIHEFIRWLAEFPLWEVYAVVLLGVGIFGEIVAIPLIYLSFEGLIHVKVAWLLIIVGSVTAEVIFYYLGYFISYDRLRSLPFLSKKIAFLDKFSKFFILQSVPILLVSKLVFGTRTVLQVFAGMHKIPFRIFFFANTAGIALWTLFLFAIARAVHDSLESLHIIAHRTELGFSIFIAIAVVVYILGRSVAKRIFAHAEAYQGGDVHVFDAPMSFIRGNKLLAVFISIVLLCATYVVLSHTYHSHRGRTLHEEAQVSQATSWQPCADPGSNKATITFPTEAFSVDLACTSAAQEQGLSDRPSMPQGNGMLFVFPDDGTHTMWMKDMNFPLDMAWISKGGLVVYIEEYLTPETFPEIFGSPIPSRYVLEINGGTISASRIKVGDKVAILPP